MTLRLPRLLAPALALMVLTGIVLEARIAHAADPSQKVARLGFVSPESPSTSLPRNLKAFWDHLHELDYVEGRNLLVETRWAEGHLDRLPTLMDELVAQKVDVIFTYTTPAAIAAKSATSTVPIVAAALGDPVGTGLAVSLAHPGGNLTGLSMGFVEGMAGKWLELLHETVPGLSQIAVIANTDNPSVREMAKELKAVAPNRGVKLRFFEVREPEALERAFQQARSTSQAVLVLADPITVSRRWEITALAAKRRLPAMYNLLEFVNTGGLMGYAPDQVVMFRRAADYVDKILKGAKPGDLPIEQPTKYVLVINLKTAKTLGITIPESILLRADEVIR